MNPYEFKSFRRKMYEDDDLVELDPAILEGLRAEEALDKLKRRFVKAAEAPREWADRMRQRHHKPTIDARQIAACRKHFPTTDRVTEMYELTPGMWSRPEPREMYVPYTDFIRFGMARFEDEVRRMMQAVIAPVPLSEGSVERIGDGTDGHIIFRWTPA